MTRSSILLGMTFVATCASAAWRAGLNSGSVSGAPNWTAYPTSTNIVAGPMMAKTTAGWGASTTYVYWGQIYLDGSTYNFAESIDDGTMLKIDGQTIFTDTAWNKTATGSIQRPAGWYDFEVRFYNGSSGAGPANQDGWGTTAFGFGYNTSGYTGKSSASYAFPEDSGDGSLFRHDDGMGFGDVLTIVGTPGKFGEVSPSYGMTNQLAVGEAIVCTAPASWTSDDGKTRATCAGYRIYTNDVLYAQGPDASFTYRHPDSEMGATLEWQWDAEYKVTAAAAVGGTVSKSEEWVERDGSFTVTATPADGCVFYNWTDGNGKVVSYDASLTLPVMEPIALTAHFGGSYYVAKDGSDENDGLTRETAKLDPEKLIPTLPAGSTVYIDEGTYTLAGDWIQLTNDIAVVGIGADRTAVKFNSARQDDPTTKNSSGFPDESNGRRLFRVASSGSRLVNVTLTDAAWEVYRMANVQSPGALQVEAGLVSNCVIKASKGSDFNGGAALVTGGTVTHSLFYGNQAYRSSNAGAQTVGGAIKQTGGLVECCVLSNNTCVSEGGNLWISGGVFRRSRICKTTSTSRVGVAAHVEGTALVELCEIDHIQADSAVVSQTGGTVRNCFIHDNTAANEAGGIRLTGGTAEYCTVVNNKSQNVKTGGIYLNGANAVARYNVSYLNGDTAANAACNLKIEKGTATDNVATDPSFADAPNGDFSLGAGSPAIDIVAAVDGVTDDIGGNARPKDGDGDGEARNDAGCFEAPGANEGPLRCSFAVTGEAMGLNHLETTFKASVAGEGADGEIVYSWDLNGDGVVDFTGAQYQTVSWTYENCGRFDVSLVVSNGKDSVGFTYPGCIGVGASRIYVNAENKDNAVWPYATWETAASDINVALDTVLWTEGVKVDMIVTNGTYKINSKWLMIEKPMTLTSVEGPTKTILSANNSEATNKRRVMYVNHDDAFVSGFTMRDGNWQAYYHQDIPSLPLRVS